jgi:pSer/pThr/pTyr-binding forkhead associated (FHA) protein
MLESALTLPGAPEVKDQMVSRLQYLSDLLAEAGNLPRAPLLLWRETQGTIRQLTLDNNLVIGRQPEPGGLAFAGDKLMSRSHFAIRRKANSFWMEDLKSHNGTAVNEPEQLTSKRMLCNGDVIFAGQQIFVFLNQ